jgi:hypothetical protein
MIENQQNWLHHGREVQKTGVNPYVARCLHLAALLPHLAERNPNSLEIRDTTGERWPRTSLPFILPSNFPSKSPAYSTPAYDIQKAAPAKFPDVNLISRPS